MSIKPLTLPRPGPLCLLFQVKDEVDYPGGLSPSFPRTGLIEVIWHCPWARLFRSQFVPGSLWSQAEHSLVPQANQADALVSQLPNAFFISPLLTVSIPPALLEKTLSFITKANHTVKSHILSSGQSLFSCRMIDKYPGAPCTPVIAVHFNHWGCDAGLGMVGGLGPPLMLLASDNSEPALYGHNRCLNHDLSPKLQLAQNNPCT